MTWLGRVQTLYERSDLSYREIAQRAGMSHTHAANIVAGRSVPSLPILSSLVRTLAPQSPHLVDSILTQFAAEVPQYMERSTQHRKVPAASQQDIHDLTAAIHRLTAKLDEALQESRRWPDHR